MNVDTLLKILNDNLIKINEESLNIAETLVLQGILANKTYNEMATIDSYSPGYFSNIVAPELFRKLSPLVGSPLTKKNFNKLISSYYNNNINTTNIEQTPVNNVTEVKTFPYPSGAVPLNSPFYIHNSSLEEQICQEIQKQGALVRIKAPREKGKTSLLLRILDAAEKMGLKIVSLNLEQIDQDILKDLSQFLRWLCKNVTRQLRIDSKLDEYWDEDLGNKMSWTLYFEDYILPTIKAPLVIAFDEIQQIFEYPQLAKDFFPLLRSCSEEAKRHPLWQKLRLIVVYSTEIYVPLQLDQSPFNVGLPIKLDNFSLEKVKQLAQKYQLDWISTQEIQKLIDLLGGHPALIHLAIYHLHQDKTCFNNIIQTAPSLTGIFANHLQRHWIALQQKPELWEAFQKVMIANETVILDPIIGYKLNSLGLIDFEGRTPKIACKLYRDFFENH